MSTNIGFIGAGNMANSLIRGLINHGSDPKSIWAVDIDAGKLQQLAGDCGINTGSNEAVVRRCDVLILAVKPQVIPVVARQLGAILKAAEGAEKPLVISIAAGITLAHLGRWLGEGLAIIRCMPNTPALVGIGATALFGNPHASSEQCRLAESITSSVGVSVWVDLEQDLDAVTALSGSGPAYFFLFMEAMEGAAREMGLDADTARTLTCQTALGAAQMALHSEDGSAELRRRVTSPGGTTERAIATFEQGDIRDLIKRALKAARDRSKEMATEIERD